MKQISTLLLLALSTVCFLSINSCSADSDGAKKNQSSNLQNDMGGELYRQNCRLCHGHDGKKMLAGASDLSQSELDFDSRIAVITKGRGNMAAFGDKLSESEIQALANYLESLLAD